MEPASAGPGSPLLSKLYQESNLRLAPGQAALHPCCGMAQGARAMLESAGGRCEIRVTLDSGVPPGVVVMTGQPRLMDICRTGAPAKVVRI